ncbi:hypothetical protein [Cellulomonas edaphi]|uniref:Flp pilus-assembly TadG-like N-terminal domain-containing protein n=1 Tax=Cellulomonas edaphi TaxID=3053468 RepID=A0ABT7SA14_9CELL|nr:hypothetical protein [Cellulomons edaphi]MDM7832473.1 hypothetical protein [Cellulomons edaphi]
MRARRGDDGQIMLLTLGFVVVAMLLVSVVVSAAGVHLERKRLLALADVMALEAADAVDDDAYFASGAGRGDPRTEPAEVSTASVRRAVGAYLHDNPAAATRWSRFAYDASAVDDGATAHVELVAVVHPVFWSWVLKPWKDGITISAESDASAR